MYACTGRYRISMGVTGMAIVRAIVGGERDARQLAQLRDRRCHQSGEAIAEQLSGHWRADHLFTLGQALKMYDAIQERIAEYEREIMEECRGQAAPKLDNPKKAQAIKKRGEEPLRQALYRISGVDLKGRAMLASAALPEVQHIRPHVPPGLQARAALHLVIRADLAHRGRDGILVIRLVLGGNRQTRLEVRNGFVRARQRRNFRAFDVHLDEIHARQLQLRHQLINRGQRHQNAGMRRFRTHHYAISRKVGVIHIQREGVVFIPYAFRVHDHASAGRLRGQIAPDAFHAGGRDFDRNHRLRPGLQRLAREIAVARAAIQHHVAGVNEMLARAIDVLLHLRQVGRQHVTVAFGDPKLALGRAPQLQTAVFLHQVAARQDAVLYALLVHIGLALDGVRHRANRAVAGDHQRPWPDWGKDEVGRHSGGDQNDEGKNDAGSLHIVINNPMSAPANVKVVLVTGASSGIGQAIARHLAARGWRVFGTSRRETTGFDGVDMLPMEVDDDDSVTRAVSAIAEKTGRLDAVVNNAGWALMGPVEDTDRKSTRAQMETNFFGVL